MKTVIQEVYYNFNLMSDADFKAWMLNNDLEKKEREQMIEFAEQYFLALGYKSAEHYFDRVFNTKEK